MTYRHLTIGGSFSRHLVCWAGAILGTDTLAVHHWVQTLKQRRDGYRLRHAGA